MESSASQLADDPVLARALTAIRGLRSKIEADEEARHESIAIVGIGCRLPGAVRSPADFWTLLTEGRDAISEIPASRWDADAFYAPDPATPGRMALRHGGFLEAIDSFDPRFFGISPREAARIDPQQRLFLEVAWEALEDAGIPAEALRGSATSVFVGANATDYLQLQLADAAEIDLYTTVGSANCIIANRLSYFLDLRGLSLTIDSACSSSLVALHLACRELRARESDLAIVGGVNVIASPMATMGHAKGLPISSDGRCKTFDAAADGYARGEGVAGVVLKRLSDAQAAQDRIWAVVRGSAVNQDGLTNGLTAPNGNSQRRAIRSALDDARLAPDQVAFIECHGTGTALGDPIEVEALDEIYGVPARDGSRCAIGSVKTNIGHLEAGAGVVGLIKAALSIHHAAIAPNLHLHHLNPELELDRGRLFVPTEPTTWPQEGDNRHAAISSFGAGGTNAHVILSSAPQRPEPGAGAAAEHAPRPDFLPLSAATADALKPMAAAFRDLLDAPRADGATWPELAGAALIRRTHHEHRCGVVAGSAEQAVERLTAWLDAQAPSQVVSGRASAPIGRRVAFVCPGQGAQHPGMGWDLLEHCSAFREALHACDEAMHPLLGCSITGEIARIGPDSGVQVVQPALFAISIALAARLRSLGIRPDFVVGHSMGEVAAAHIAGALSLPDAATIMCRRSAMLSRIAGRGAMLLVAQSAPDVEALVAARADRVSLAASNGPMSTVLSGDATALDEIEAQLAAANVFARRVKVDVASHSPHVDPLLDELVAELEDIAPRSGTVPIMSTVTGKMCDGSEFDAAYWARNLRWPVRFWDATRALVEHDAGVFIELGPHPVLSSAVEQTFEQSEDDALALPMMRRDQPALETSAELLATLWANAHPAAPPMRAAGTTRAVQLPAYAWQHQKLWFRKPGGAARPPQASAPAASPSPSPRLGANGAGAELRSASERPGLGTLSTVVSDAVAEVLHLEPADVDPRMGFFQMGMDSMLAARVRSLIEARLERRFPARVMFEHPTVEALSAFLAGPSNGQPGVPMPQQPAAAPSRARAAAEAVDPAVERLTEDELLTAMAREMLAPIDDKAGHG